MSVEEQVKVRRNARLGIFVFSRNAVGRKVKMWSMSQCPLGHFCFLTPRMGGVRREGDDGSQCPLGHFCFLTASRQPGQGRAASEVAMPAWAFLFSHQHSYLVCGWCGHDHVAMPAWAFLFSHAYGGIGKYRRLQCRNARLGIFVFSHKNVYWFESATLRRNARLGIFVFSLKVRVA